MIPGIFPASNMGGYQLPVRGLQCLVGVLDENTPRPNLAVEPGQQTIVVPAADLRVAAVSSWMRWKMPVADQRTKRMGMRSFGPWRSGSRQSICLPCRRRTDVGTRQMMLS